MKRIFYTIAILWIACLSCSDPSAEFANQKGNYKIYYLSKMDCYMFLLRKTDGNSGFMVYHDDGKFYLDKNTHVYNPNYYTLGKSYPTAEAALSAAEQRMGKYLVEFDSPTIEKLKTLPTVKIISE